MKKNTMMRLASVLLVCVLLTTSVISGTFAKYTTSADAEDTARVAHWGVELTVTGGDQLFSQEYTGTAGKITVKSSNNDDVVAPGTTNNTAVVFTLKGTPEVATKVTATLGETKDVFLKYGNNKENTYYPVVFTLTHTYGADAFSIAPVVADTGATVTTSPGKDVITGTLAQIQAVLTNLTNNMTQVNPNYVYDDTFTLTWAWAFQQTNVDDFDKLDTILGNLAAGKTVVGYDTGDYNLTLKYDFSITVEQVD